MSEPRRVLVVANVTATAAALTAEMMRLAAQAPTLFTLLVPAYVEAGDRNLIWEENEVWAAATRRMENAVTALRGRGLEVEGHVGDADPVNAVQDLLLTERFDLVVVSTLPEQRSRWLVLNLPDRIARTTGLPVRHVIAQPEPVTASS